MDDSGTAQHFPRPAHRAPTSRSRDRDDSGDARSGRAWRTWISPMSYGWPTYAVDDA
ncbi:hypothetical protein GCM10009775_13400 [Microbacterium aoyamense]|uniref:Uncharacterized protein n=1 Tax=Microbacterium aoyamense TaxID=344166 RepID=A0ABP5AX74_9MICO|nr:hypothetical protein [Microbacterium aoyamense]